MTGPTWTTRPVQCDYCGRLGAHHGQPCDLRVKEHEQRMILNKLEHDERVAAIRRESA